MKTTTFTMKTDDGVELFIHQWMPDNQPKAIIQIAHGMAEHSQRYEDFAAFLVKNELGVYAHDHRGHGKTAGSVDKLGFFAETDGWAKVLADMRMITKHIVGENSDIPVFLFGHSMGSFFTRNYIAEYTDLVHGAILSGTGGHPGLLGKVGVLLTKLLTATKGKHAQTPLMTKLSFGEFNKAFKPNRTDYDWLSRDTEQVDKYINDPYCGTVFSVGFFRDMLSALLVINDEVSYQKTSNNLPIFLVAGAADPVGDNGKGVTEVYNKYKNAGLSNVEIKLYEDARHEILNEINRDDVYRVVRELILKQI